MPTNGNGNITWKVVASVVGGILMALLGWAANALVDQVEVNTKTISELDKRIAIMERSQGEILRGQAIILEEIRKGRNDD